MLKQKYNTSLFESEFVRDTFKVDFKCILQRDLRSSKTFFSEGPRKQFALEIHAL